MKNLLEAGKLLLLDMASTLFFLVLYLLTHNVTLSVVLGMALGIAQIGWQLARHKPIDTMQWMSLFLVLGAGTVTLITDDPRFVMIKPSVIYIIVGVVMLKRGWINRYLPPAACRDRAGAGYRRHSGLRLVGPDVLLRCPERVRGPQLQRGDLVGGHVDLRHRQQGHAVPDRLRRHAHRRRAPPSASTPARGCRR
jgi:Intracellular septation protein A